MSAIFLSGKECSKYRKLAIKEEISNMRYEPCLAIIEVGDDFASGVYIRNKLKACEEVGIETKVYRFDSGTKQDVLEDNIKDICSRYDINTVLLQLPVPEYLNEDRLVSLIPPEKDADCFSSENFSNLITGKSTFGPCTPFGIITLLDFYGIKIPGRHCVVVGRSNIVGKPMASMLLNRDATVTICHSRTRNLPQICRQADILISAVGKKGFITADFVKPGATVVDVGINRDVNGKVCGDVDTNSVASIAEYITPVPGGVGPMTVTSLLENVLYLTKRQRHQK